MKVVSSDIETYCTSQKSRLNFFKLSYIMSRKGEQQEYSVFHTIMDNKKLGRTNTVRRLATRKGQRDETRHSAGMSQWRYRKNIDRSYT